MGFEVLYTAMGLGRAPRGQGVCALFLKWELDAPAIKRGRDLDRVYAVQHVRLQARIRLEPAKP
jgi:hypothetical protein